MDKQPVGQVNSNTWSNRTSRKYEGFKPPVPPKPPRKSLASQVSDPSHPGSLQSISRGFYHPHYLTLSQSRKAPSFDYHSDSGTRTHEVPFKRASSIDGSSSGDWSLYNSSRLSTFISNEKRSDSSTAPNVNKSSVSDNIKLFSQTANHNQIANDHHNNNKAQLPVAYRANTLGRSNTIANSFNKQAFKQITLGPDDDKVFERNRSSLPASAKPVNQAIFNTHLRSKSEHHPRCPNRNIVLEKVQDFDQMSRQSTSHNLKTTQSATNLNLNQKSLNLPSSEEALQSIKSVIEPIYKISDACSDACNHFPPFLLHNYLNGSPTSSFENCTEDSDSSMSFKSCHSNSPSSSSEYLNHKSNCPKDAETSTDDCLVITEGVNGEKVYVKLRRPMPLGKFEDKNTSTDQSLTVDDLDESLLEGLKRGSRVPRKSVSGDGRSSLRKSKTIGKNTLERRKMTRSLNVHKKSLSHETASLDRRASHHVDSGNTHQSDLDRSFFSRLSFDENKEWEKVAEIVASFGSSFLKTSEKLDLSSSFFSSKISVDEWLSDLSLKNYIDLFNSNGYDSVEFMNCLSENDLLEMGITDEEDRFKLLDAAAKLPSVKKLSDERDISLRSWLSLLKLDQYEPIFIEKGYDDLNKIRKLWDIELSAVLQINKLGHKRRILASLGKDSNLINDFTLSFDKLNFDVAELHDFDLQNLPDSRPESKLDVSSARASDIESDRMSIASDIRIETSESIPSPMRSSITSTTPISSPWKHDPLELYKNGCAYRASYLGSTLVSELEGIKSTRESIMKLRNSTKGINKIPSVTLQISHTGVKFIDSQMNKLVCEHEIRNIHCACQDERDFVHFAYITKDHETNNDFCHVFCAENIETATEIILTLGQAFDIAYRLAVGEDINTLRENFIENYHQE